MIDNREYIINNRLQVKVSMTTLKKRSSQIENQSQIIMLVVAN